MGEFDIGFGEEPKPINRQPALDLEDIKQSFRLLREKHEGEELLQKQAEFVLFTVMEVVLVEDEHPDVLRLLDSAKVELIKSLNPEM